LEDTELIKREIKQNGKTQAQIATSIGLNRSSLNKYLNGHKPLTKDLCQKIAVAIDSPILIKKYFRTTSSDILFDVDYSNIHEILMKVEIELDELQKAIDETKLSLINAGHKLEMDKEQVKAVKHLLDQNEDVNQASDILDIACKVRGFDLDERNRRYKEKCKRRYNIIGSNTLKTNYVYA
jgi:transcriptional regulator with XRE-family HTH domain